MASGFKLPDDHNPADQARANTIRDSAKAASPQPPAADPQPTAAATPSATGTSPQTPSSSAPKKSPLDRLSSTPGAATPVSKLATKVLGKRNKKTLYGIIAAVVLLVAIIGAILAIPLRLIHIAKVLFGHNFDAPNHTSVTAERKVLMRIFGEHLDKDGGYRSATGKFLKDRFTNTRIDNIKTMLAQDGITMEYDSNNRFVGLSKDGKRYGPELKDKSFWERRAATSATGDVGSLIIDRLAPHRYLQHVLYTKAFRLHAGVSFKFWSKEKAGNLKERIVSKVRRGYTADESLDSEPGAKRKNSAPDVGDGAKDDIIEQASEAVRAQAEEFKKTNDITAAHKAGIDAFKLKALKSGLGFTGLAMFYCVIKEMVDEANREGYMERMTALIREGNMILTMQQQMYTGELTIDEFGQMMARFDGDPNANPAKDENAKDFTQAAAWRRATDQPVNTAHTTDKDYQNYNPDLSQAANPDGKVLQGIVGSIAEIFTIPGSSGVCGVLNSWVGWVIQGVELTVALFEGETTTLIASGIKAAASGYIVETLVPIVLDAATALSVTGTENPVGLINNTDAGLKLSAMNYARVMGDKAGTDAEGAAIAQAADAENQAIAQQKGWTYRTFALSNTNSVASKLLLKTPTSPANFVASIRNAVVSLPTNLATIFFRPRIALADTPSNPYLFRSYVTADQDIDQIDPLDAEDFLTTRLSNGKSRLEMLGDPSTYTPANGNDTNANDLMHCFVNTFRSDQPQDADEICKDLGVLTKSGKDNPENPGKAQIIDKIYCDLNSICNLPWNNNLPIRCSNDIAKVCGTASHTDFDIYRIYLKYVFLTRGFDGLTTDTDPFAATAVAPSAPPALAYGQFCPTGQDNITCAADLAQKILGNPNVTYLFGSTRNDLELTANRQPLPKDQWTCNKAGVRLHPALLYALYQSSLQFKIKLSNIVTPHGCDAFLHPLGRAMDIDYLVDSAGHTSNAGYNNWNGENPAVDRAFAEYIAKYLPPGSGIGQAGNPDANGKTSACFAATLPNNIRANYDVCTHIHVDIGRQIP